MNSKFKRTRIAALLLIASGTANTVCAQSYTPNASPQGGPPASSPYRPSQNETYSPGSNGSLPPIVSGSQQPFGSAVIRSAPTNLPPIVSGAQNRQLQQRPLPPIVSGNSVNRSGSSPTGSQPSLNQNAQNTAGQPSANSRMLNPLRPIQVPQGLDSFPRSSQGQESASSNTSKPSATSGSLPQSANRLQAGQVLSASGVPYYSSSAPKSMPRLRVEQDGSEGSIMESAVRGEPNQPAAQQPAAQQPAARQPAARQPMSRDGMSSVVSPREGQDVLLPGENSNGMMDPRMNARGDMSFPSDNQSYFDTAPRLPSFTEGCQDCVAAGGISNCPTCSPDSSYAMGAGGIDSTSGYFGAMSRARRYAELDFLYLTRTDGSIVFSNFGGLGSFDANVGWRFTLGQREDETQGKEFSYFGTSDLSAEANRVDPGNRLSALFSPAGVIDVSLTQPFFDANIQNESMQTSLHSIEFNRVSWAWDVVKSFIGFRYIYVDDSYNLFSQRGVNTADYQIESLNNLVGVHIGREIFYDIGYRISFSALGKAGIYANANRFNVNVANNGVPFIDNRNDSSTFSTSLELMLTGHYQINRRSRVRVGYQALLLDDVYSISDNLTGTLSPFFGSREADKDSMFFHGINIGLEFYR